MVLTERRVVSNSPLQCPLYVLLKLKASKDGWALWIGFKFDLNINGLCDNIFYHNAYLCIYASAADGLSMIIFSISVR